MADDPQQLVRDGMRHQEAGDLAGARALYARALNASPGHPDALHLSGLAALQAGDFDDAVHRIQKAVDRVPDHPVLRNNLGLALHKAGTLVAAAGQLQKALELRADYGGAHMNLGAVYADLRDREGALEHGLKAVELEPERAEAWFNLGLFLLDRVELVQAIEAFRRALAINPHYPAAATSLLFTLNLAPGLAADAVSGEHRRVAAAVYGAPPVRPPAAPGKRVRIGFVSADFRRHAVNHFFEPLAESLDRSRFEMIAYSDTADPDDVTRRLRGLADAWRESRDWSDEQLEAAIREDRIDVLFDLAGHTRGNRLGVFAKRPAPVQLGWLGYPHHPGLEALDGQLADAFTAARAPRGAGLLPLDGVFACFRPAEHAPAVTPLPAAERGFVTLGSLHKLEKINESVVACWARTLESLPGARLLLVRDHLDAWQRRRLLGQFDAHGIDESRLELMPGQPSGGSFQAFWAEIDLYLDTFPWSGHTMACHALWAGVPLVTLAGESHASRMVGSVLHALGREEWIATDEAGYVDTVARLAGDLDELARHRRCLREDMAAGAVTDAEAFARNFERAVSGQLNAPG